MPTFEKRETKKQTNGTCGCERIRWSDSNSFASAALLCQSEVNGMARGQPAPIACSRPPQFAVWSMSRVSLSLLGADGAAAAALAANTVQITVHNLFSATAISITETFLFTTHFVRAFAFEMGMVKFIPASFVAWPSRFLLNFVFFKVRPFRASFATDTHTHTHAQIMPKGQTRKREKKKTVSEMDKGKMQN